MNTFNLYGQFHVFDSLSFYFMLFLTFQDKISCYIILSIGWPNTHESFQNYRINRKDILCYIYTHIAQLFHPMRSIHFFCSILCLVSSGHSLLFYHLILMLFWVFLFSFFLMAAILLPYLGVFPTSCITVPPIPVLSFIL